MPGIVKILLLKTFFISVSIFSLQVVGSVTPVGQASHQDVSVTDTSNDLMFTSKRRERVMRD